MRPQECNESLGIGKRRAFGLKDLQMGARVSDEKNTLGSLIGLDLRTVSFKLMQVLETEICTPDQLVGRPARQSVSKV